MTLREIQRQKELLEEKKKKLEESFWLSLEIDSPRASTSGCIAKHAAQYAIGLLEENNLNVYSAKFRRIHGFAKLSEERKIISELGK